MPWVHFTGDHSFTPARLRGVTIAYKKGMRLLVTTECAGQAIAAGLGQRVPTPHRDHREAFEIRRPK